MSARAIFVRARADATASARARGLDDLPVVVCDQPDVGETSMNAEKLRDESSTAIRVLDSWQRRAS
jgi:hypothetical protein